MAVGRRLGNYDIERELGRGGMGAVYVGKHQLLGRAAAVKILQPHYSKDQDVVKRFFNEARAATAIRHPSIVEIFDFGFAEDGSAFIVMELCDGESLATRLRRTRVLSTPVALAIARQIAGALAAAHKAGIIHRDLKPDNVFLVPDPEVIGGERIKLLDFGIAKLASDASSPSATQTGAILGTPYYMSPEQCRGAGQVDHRADLYSLGCILFEMVCGRVPFVGEGAGDIIGAHLYLAAPKPSAMAPGLAADVEALILSLLAKKADERPSRADLVVTAIHAIAGTSPQPSRENVALLSTAAGSEPGKKPSPALAFGDTVGSSPGAAVPSAIGSSPGLDSTEPSGRVGLAAATPAPIASPSPMATPAPIAAPAPIVLLPAAAPATPEPIPPVAALPALAPHIASHAVETSTSVDDLARGTPPVVHVTPKRTTARMSAQVPPIPRRQKLAALVLFLAAIGSVLAAYVAWPQMPKRVPHQVRIVDIDSFDSDRTETQLEVVAAEKPGDPPSIRATIIGGPEAYDDSPEVFALVEHGSKVPTTMPAVAMTPLATSDDSISIVVLVQGTERWLGFDGVDHRSMDRDQSLALLKALNTTFSRIDMQRLPEKSEITFIEYSAGATTKSTRAARNIGAAPLGRPEDYAGKVQNDLAIGVTHAIIALKKSYSARKFLIVIGDGTDTNNETAKRTLYEMKKEAANSNITMFGILMKEADTSEGIVLRTLIPKDLVPIKSLDGLVPAMASIVNRIVDRYYVTFPTYDTKKHVGLTLDGKEHDLAVRVGEEELEPVTLLLPRWTPPVSKPTRSWILGGVSLVLLIAGAAVLLRGRRQRQLLAIPRA